MKKDCVKWITISDVHLGNGRNKAFRIIANIRSFFNDYKKRTDGLDIIFIAGDLFDKLLDLANDATGEALSWMTVFLEYCCINNIKLRIMEGTPSHDWLQSRFFNMMCSASKLPVDVQYIKTLHIEHMDDLGIDILYIPDEWSTTTDDTLTQVKQLMAEKHLSQIDIAIMHGQFAYQLPTAAIKIPKHNEAEYLAIVRYYINIGHVHIFSSFEHIIAQGSFDRLSHNEEEKKGGIYCIANKDGTKSYTRLINTNAKIFKTVRIRSLDKDTYISQLDKVVEATPIDSHIRISAKPSHPIFLAFDEIKLRYVMYNISKHVSEAEEETVTQQLVAIDSKVGDDELCITKDNITDMLMGAISNKFGNTNIDIEQHKKLLNTFL